MNPVVAGFGGGSVWEPPGRKDPTGKGEGSGCCDILLFVSGGSSVDGEIEVDVWSTRSRVSTGCQLSMFTPHSRISGVK